MRIKTKIEERAVSVQSTLTAQAQAKFIAWLMDEEKVDYSTAIAIVEARTDPVEWDYVLGFKLADPVLQIALFKQPSKKQRRNAAANFRETLAPEERILFDNEVFNEETAGRFKQKLKEEKKKAKKS